MYFLYLQEITPHYLYSSEMTDFCRIFFCLSILLFTSCSKKEFSLNFNLPEKVKANYNVIYYATSDKGGTTVQTVASVQDGKCELSGVTHSPTLIFISEKTKDIPLVVFIGHNDQIDISGEGKLPLTWDVAGNQFNQELTEWRLKNEAALASKDYSEINKGVAEFVKENPADPVSTILLLTYFDRKINEREYVELTGSLRGEAAKEIWFKIAGRTDQLQQFVSYPARLQSLAMKSAFNRSDTIKSDPARAILLFFWQNGIDQRSQIIDSLKTLRKEFPDSVTFVIADINLDADSISWRSPLRKDSLNGVTRLWASAGLADPNVMKFKVTTIPYFIVFDSEGHQSYRGTEVSDAIIDFRKISKK